MVKLANSFAGSALAVALAEISTGPQCVFTPAVAPALPVKLKFTFNWFPVIAVTGCDILYE